jgi:hypothetical protein
MKIFHCTSCEHLVFFENTICVRCQHKLAYLPDLETIGALEPYREDLWRCVLPDDERLYRLCGNYSRENVCNWGVPEDDAHELCYSCRFTLVAPDLSQPGNKEAWYKLEVAKRRVLYSLTSLNCPLNDKLEAPSRGLGFKFLSDNAGQGLKPVLTGHADGVITINVAEADDVERERRRQQLHEPYRTLLGHFRHEVGHYYWDRLIKESPMIDTFRKYFGDERKDYAAALQNHYQQGPSQDWQNRFVTAYAASHPWEDWAETWAHYLHMADTLETAAACGLSLRPRRSDEPQLQAPSDPVTGESGVFDEFLDNWFPLTYALNNLNRCLGLPDAYPFVLSTPAIEKLRLVHRAIGASKDWIGAKLNVQGE